GRNTTVSFKQQASSWSVLNRVNDPRARPSQIQGQIEAPGTVMIVNRNGIVFSGSSQVNTRNLVAAAVGMSDAQFRSGLYSGKTGESAN
ncbi:filamentous hemagglutinin N-terminal domain-containing protein, partial [Acinetobacter baumannii]